MSCSVEHAALHAEAARLIAAADGLIIAAGAGMGVDSGLPDFRGNSGFWRAYPALADVRITFEEIANPATFRRNPVLAWGFYGHRLNLYRNTRPHHGFTILREIGGRLPKGAFVFTSNVDGQFQRAGYDENEICEVHGSIHHLQCVDGCDGAINPADDFTPNVDDKTCRLLSPLPRCLHCNSVLRPNVLMFGDGDWLGRRSNGQHRRLEAWLQNVNNPVIVEIGAGNNVPTVRWFSETLGEPLVRINPTEPEIPGHGISIPQGGLAALIGIHSALTAQQFFA